MYQLGTSNRELSLGYMLFSEGPFHVLYNMELAMWYLIYYIIGKQILDRRYEQIKDDIARGDVDETKAVGK